MRVTRNLVIDLVRRRRLHAVHAEGLAAETAAARLAGSAPAAEAETSPALRAALESAIAALDEPYRSLLVVREIQGFSYDQIAEVFGMPLGTVKAYLHRARRRVREALLREWKDDD
jgi:RNA polymerase sigma-70 factor (ECF subfamily)